MRYLVLKTCDVNLWGVPADQRITRILSKCGCFERIFDAQNVPPDEKILVLRMDYLYDEAVLRRLVTRRNVLLTGSGDSFPVAGVVDGHLLQVVSLAIEDEKRFHHSSVLTINPRELSGGYQARLRKLEQTHVVRIVSSRKRLLENYLYNKSYKGITDLVTKWVWPYPSRWCVRRCVDWSITPNTVTSLGLLLTIVAGYFFWQGMYFAGLIAGWLMTFLDTVDGKLARVTMQSSKIGHVMDHGLDIVHPPIWYALWAYGLGLDEIQLLGTVWPVDTLVWLMLGGYVLGRVFEGLFQLMFDDLSIFCWHKLDSYHRLITARRNPCLILLTGGLLMGLPEYGFTAVVIWTLLSTAFLFYRFAAGSISRLQKGKLHSWIEAIHHDQSYDSLTARLFAGASLDHRLLMRDAY